MILAADRSYANVVSTCSRSGPSSSAPAPWPNRGCSPAKRPGRSSPAPHAVRSNRRRCFPAPQIALCVASATPPSFPVPASSLRTSPLRAPIHPMLAHTPSAPHCLNRFRLPRQPPQAALLLRLSYSPRFLCDHLLPVSSSSAFRTRQPESANSDSGLGESPARPRQCSIACPEPCSQRGIRTNDERVLTAVVSFVLYAHRSPVVTIYVQSSIAGGRAHKRCNEADDPVPPQPIGAACASYSTLVLCVVAQLAALLPQAVRPGNPARALPSPVPESCPRQEASGPYEPDRREQKVSG
jgi:hypothetical protein